tara:strand:+ start:266 stop:448 length:183 start_codon:yes stop_codon:yes gene_type:complete
LLTVVWLLITVYINLKVGYPCRASVEKGKLSKSLGRKASGLRGLKNPYDSVATGTGVLNI